MFDPEIDQEVNVFKFLSFDWVLAYANLKTKGKILW